MSFATDIKVIFIFTLFFSAGLAGFLIMACKRLKQSKRFLSFGNCFASGIFLLVGMVHLLRESQDTFAEALGEDLPVGYIVSIGGFSLILFIEHVLFGGHDHSLDNDCHDHQSEKRDNLKQQTTNLKNEIEKPSIKVVSGSDNPDQETDGRTSSAVTLPVKNDSKLPGVILTTALVVHSIIEGIAAGIINNESVLVILCVAILVHNIPAAFALGVKIEFLPNVWRIPLMLAFITSSPLGIAIGIGLSEMQQPFVIASFLAVSAGTFIYIGCTEILPEQFHDKEDKWVKFGGFLLGYIPLALMSVFVDS